jgi:hypothetical protein
MTTGNSHEPDPVAGPGMQEEAPAYVAGPSGMKPLDDRLLQTLTVEGGKTVEAALQAHLKAGRTVYGLDPAGKLIAVRPNSK